MAKIPVEFRQDDVKRAVKGALAAGLNVVRITVGQGRIEIHTAAQPAELDTPLDAWRRQNGQG